MRNARFELSPQIFELKRAFVGVAHEVVLRIRNVSDVVGRWTFPAQELSDACIIQSELQTAVLAPGAAQKVRVNITPRCTGEIVAPVTFLSDAAEKQTLQCMVQYSARGPIVEPSCDVLKFPVARLLDHQQRVLTLTSKSLSDCMVTVGAARPGSFFTIPTERQKFLLRAGEQAEVPVVFSANTSGSHQDFLLIACELANPACEVSDEVKK